MTRLRREGVSPDECGAARPSGPTPAQTSEDPLAHIALGHLLVKERRFEDAEHSFRKALALDPEMPMAHNNLGWVREMQGDFGAAIASYARALELNGSLHLAAPCSREPRGTPVGARAFRGSLAALGRSHRRALR